MIPPPIPEEWMNPQEDPEKTYIYWESHTEHLIFFKKFIKEKLLSIKEYWSIAWNAITQPDYDNGWSKIWILSYILRDYTNLIVNNKELPSDLSKIDDLLDTLDKDCSQRKICENYGSLKEYICRTYQSLRDFYTQTGVIFEN